MTTEQLEGHVLVLELEAAAAAALSAAGFPADLTRAPRPDEIASRTSYAAMETATLQVAHQVAQLAVDARREAIALVSADLVTAHDVAAVIARLDELAAAVRTLPGARQLVDEISARTYTHLVNAATAALTQFMTDAAEAGVTVAPSTTLSTSSLVALDAQATRVASEAIAAALRAARGAAYSTRRGQSVVDFHKTVIDTANDGGTKGLEDVAHQASLRATGAGRMDGVNGVEGTDRTVGFYASELLDRHTCSPCSDIDGAEFTAEEAMEAYPDGQYVGCLGGARCRGTIVAVDRSETPAARAVPGDVDSGDDET